jgi:hypothetical protein
LPVTIAGTSRSFFTARKDDGRQMHRHHRHNQPEHQFVQMGDLFGAIIADPVVQRAGKVWSVSVANRPSPT